MSNALPKWDEAREQTLISTVGDKGSEVSVNVVTEAAEALGTTTRSVASKLRKMGYAVASMAKEHGKRFSVDQEEELRRFVEANAGTYTYAEIAANVCAGKFSAKQVQGKLLSMELTNSVKPTPKVEVAKTYSEAEEAKLNKLLRAGGYIEDIALSMGREVASVRGKILSMMRGNPDIKIPPQRNVKEKAVDPVAALGDLSAMTVADIAEATGKSERGVKTLLTRRGISCKNYDGEARAAKAAAKAE